MELQGRKILVVGFGKTGFSTTRFLLERGALVTLSDIQKKIDIPREFIDRGVLVEAGEHRLETFLRQDGIVLSPGVSLLMRPVIEARARGIEVISEIELAWRFLRTPLIAVTGTNGKTTTTSLIGSMFSQAGKKVFVGGNIGTPLIEALTGGQTFDYIISEISSFQLEAIAQFRPAVSVLLNITEDHLDRHPSFEDYVRAKGRIFENQRTPDVAILNYDDPRVRDLGTRIAADPFYFSITERLADGAYYNGRFHLCRPGAAPVAFPVHDALLQGAHNKENMLAAAAAGFACGLPAETVRAALVGFQGLPHRMEFVDRVGGVTFYNDSKGTNVGAVVKSLESLDPPLILIAGGKDKGGSYQPLRELVRDKVKALILLGEAKERIAEELGSLVPTVLTASLEQAVDAAFQKAASGDCVLFSPACSSFDMFQSYAHRGQCFRDLVRKLKGSVEPCTTKA
jgi:UDP-N-acetylmuramoylalanine--D-glutamate ligase